DLLEVANALIEKKTAPFDAKAYKDHYSESLRELLDAKLKNKKIKRISADEEERPVGGNVIDLMAALKKSLEGSEGTGKAGAAGGKKGGRGSAKKETEK